MLRSKKFQILILLGLLVSLFIACVPAEFQNSQGDIVNNQAVKSAISERIKAGGTLKDALPPTSVMIVGTFVPISAIVGFFVVLFLFLRQLNRRDMAMIEKGIYQKTSWKIKWDMIMLFIGVILLFTGPGISIWFVSFYGLHSWSIFSGVIPLFVGIAFLVFYKIYRKNLKQG